MNPMVMFMLRVLFIGNSYTAINDLPQLTATLAASARPSRELQTAFVGEGGATLQRHWEAGKAIEAIRAGKWDYVVLQDQGTLGPSPDFRSINDPALFHRYARLFDGEVRRAGAKTLFFMTWARQDAQETQPILTKAYMTIANELDARVAPVGVAWHNALAENPKLVLHHADRSHPASAGSYLAACVLFGVLFDSSPEGTTAIGVREDDARALQRIAWQTVKNVWVRATPPAQPGEVARLHTRNPETKDAQRLLAAAREAAGGIDRLRAIKDIAVTFSATIHSPQGEMKFDARDVLVFPATYRSEQQFAFGSVVTFVDAESGWRKTASGVSELPERMKSVMRSQITRNTFNLLRADPANVAYVERDAIEISAGGETIRLFLDPTTFAVIRKTYRGIGMGGPADLEEKYSDYREVAGVQVPFRVDITQNGAPFIEAVVSEVKINLGVDRSELSRR